MRTTNQHGGLVSRAIRGGLLTGVALVWSFSFQGNQVALAGQDPEVKPTPTAGSDVCLECHEDMADTWTATIHGRAKMPAWAEGSGCTACHGLAAEHASSGEATDVRIFGKLSVVDANQTCLGCHTRHASHWKGSTHEAMDVRCSDCHDPHAEWSDNQVRDNRKVTETCLNCHPEQKKSLFQRSAHPLRDGQMTCASCHDPHGSLAEANVAALRANEKCYECHAETRGPFLWDHIPVRENCMNCHDPHGSNQRNLLAQAPPRLCQSCHLFGHHQTVPGTPTQVWNVNNSCVNCHARIHGSNHPSGILFMR